MHGEPEHTVEALEIVLCVGERVSLTQTVIEVPQEPLGRDIGGSILAKPRSHTLHGALDAIPGHVALADEVLPIDLNQIVGHEPVDVIRWSLALIRFCDAGRSEFGSRPAVGAPAGLVDALLLSRLGVSYVVANPVVRRS